MDDQSKNLILATAMSFAVILVWFLLFPPSEQAPTAPVATETSQPATPGTATSPTLAAPDAKPRAEALALTQRVAIDTPRLGGSFSLTGGRIDDIQLLNYRETIDDNSPTVTLFSPAGAAQSYYALYGWSAAAGTAAAVPGPSTQWTVESGDKLTPATPVTLRWDNGGGLIFRQILSVDENYMFTVTQTVENTTGGEVRLAPYGIIARHGMPADLKNFYILHEGVTAMTDGTLEELKYKALKDLEPDPNEGGALTQHLAVTENGWIGFTDHYWMSTLVPTPGQSFNAVAKYTPATDTFQTDVRMPVMSVAPGATVESSTMLFAGAKVWSLLRDYQNEKGIDRFVDAIDWGWFFFLTKPIFRALHVMHNLLGNMGLAIIGLTFLIKLILFPLAYKSYVSMSKMKALQPEMEKIKERTAGDSMKMQQEVMALYKREKVNPAAGCLPILLQIPIFFSLYKVIFVTIELRHAPFFGWLRDLSAPDPSSWINGFGLLPWAAPDHTSMIGIISIGILPILLGISMWLQQRLNPMPADKTQAMIFNWMPWIFMFMLGSFASGLVLYWVANNTITFVQQYLIMRSQGVKPNVFENVTAPFRRSKKSG
ncbi:YidC/Oxa1 family membrane protein insertase [Amaricoccus macauensis]|uniref:Membrane protein insertase YidC n=1 Tax=Amaricoccus macauensis TaxID=57001 RepID=A0A840SQP3_9RHOB|nr:membrane protein insertase YidC [Amaricoccus macauensis]MBB5222885.1 YidC/Oxa1 family membrane protein insertase [Amaricoccus macauensis]